MKITYEVHALSRGRWNIEAMYKGNQRETAVEDAKRLNRESHIEAVKVVCETYNEQTNQSSEVVIFDTAKPAKEDRPQRPKMAQKKPKKDNDAPLKVRKQTKKKSGMSGMTTAMLVLALIIALGVLYVMTVYAEDISRWIG